MTENGDRRGFLRRVGISALNLLLPGLGLVRLAHYRRAVVFFLLVFALMVILLGGYCLIEQISFGEWAAIVGAVAALNLAAYLGSIAASWRASKMIEPRTGKAWRWYGILTIWALSALLTWPVRNVAHSRYRTFYAAGAAMLPTMRVNDRFLADMHNLGTIARGQLVIVDANGESYIRRVAGLPGDRIAVNAGTVILNGKPVPQQFVRKESVQTDLGIQAGSVSRERFPGEAKSHMVMDTGPSIIDDFAEIRLPPEHYFVLGDNRDHSTDSRLSASFEAGLGPVPRKAITGRIAFRYWRKGAGIGPGSD
jgi:signal peptidase I